MATNRTEVVNYVIDNYYDGDLKNAARITQCTLAQLQSWVSGKTNPSPNSINYLIECAVVPEFKVIAEFAEFDSSKALQTQLKSFLGAHAVQPGIYAFYDSMANLIYLGKASKLLSEITSALGRVVKVSFPKGVKKGPGTVKEVVRYISAYDVGTVGWDDFPKHVESLILRISKPKLNANIGFLAKAHVQPK